MTWLTVYIGHDDREPRASAVALGSLRACSGIDGTLLVASQLRERGLLWRPQDRRGHIYDLTSNAPCSTDFAFTRFLVPVLCLGTWALFVDGDVVFFDGAIDELRSWTDPRFAVMVVKHQHAPTAPSKMAGQPQLAYARKNWSSVMLFNVQHPANRRLTLHDVNTRPGLWLHQFGWLADSEIGELPPACNWLVGEQPRPDPLCIAHFTAGGPFTPGWQGAPNDDIWLMAAERSASAG